MKRLNPAFCLLLAPAAVFAAEAELPVAEVRATRGGYVSSEAGAATKSEVPLLETPQSVRVMPRELIDDIGATRLDDTFDYVSGVSRQNSFGGLWDNFAIRGLAGNENTGMNFLVNGFAGNRGFNAPRDAANIERIEFLKGPAAALYGSSEPGGTLNIVTKKPSFTPLHAAQIELGNPEAARLSVDSTAPLSDTVAYRLNFAAESKEGFRNEVESNRNFIAPALSWQLGERTLLSYEAELLHSTAPLDRGVVAVGGKLGVMPDENFLGEPADGDITIDNHTHQLNLEHELNANWRSRLGLAYKEGTFEGFSTEASALQADQRTLRRQRRYRDYSSDDLSLQGEVIGKFNLAGLQHELVSGIETYRFELDQRMLRINPSAGSPYAIDIYNPVYGQAQPTPLPNVDTLEKQRNVAAYLQDQISLSARWRLLAGLRYDSYDQTLENRRTAVTTRQDQHASSPRAGVVFLPAAGMSAYLTAGTSFRPNAGSDAGGSAFEPEKGRALEAGFKFESADRRLGGNLAVFDIRKRNALTADPVNTGFSVATGEVRSRGLEGDVAGRVGQAWRLSASFAWLDAEVLKDNTLPVGTPLLNVPRISGSVLAVHESAQSFGKLGLGGGAVHVGKRAGDATASFDLPAYTTAKLLAYWQADAHWRVGLDVDNLFDKRYYASSYNSLWVMPGEGRSVRLTLAARY